MRAPLGVAAGVTLAVVALHLRDPHRHGSWGLCPLNALTGLNCPGCGGLRAVNDLTQGRFADAAQSNLLLIVLLPLALVGWALWLRRRWTSDEPLLGRRSAELLGFGLLVVAVGFAVVRNTPWGAGLAVS